MLRDAIAIVESLPPQHGVVRQPLHVTYSFFEPPTDSDIHKDAKVGPYMGPGLDRARHVASADVVV